MATADPAIAIKTGAATAAATDVAKPRTPAPADQERAAVSYLTFWRNGFQLGRGTPLRRYDDPAQAAVLAQINAGSASAAVLGVQAGELVELRVSKRTREDYVPDSKESHVPETKEKSPASIDTSCHEPEKTSTKEDSEYIPPTKEGMTRAGRPQQRIQEEKTSWLDKTVGCTRFCL
ncbi:hypothetical protein HYPSUDRAFT_45028 [Hypholoma sublateritium FD-334 SS-4]|uniref:SEP domain-containing protein n=1 Tax=Hypholoma sublateritium (strain FD-334 SS-4) TaxID=945553 RepID=A0A0D2PEV2_HYPSF|nr:hypothetical protein HYPSUDRAFT_45028 [Hypholoma sublateritium FD-334 SS-4]